MAETVSLGEKRFVAVVQVDGRHFLLAGGPTNIALLAQLDTKDAFEDVLKKTLTVPGKQAAKRKRPANFATQAQVNRTNSLADVPQKTATARSKQPAKRASKQNAFAQGPQTRLRSNHLNGTEQLRRCAAEDNVCRQAAGESAQEAEFQIDNRTDGVLRVRNAVIARAMLCIMLCLGATSAEAMARPAVQAPERALA